MQQDATHRTRLHGSGCALVLVDAGAKPVYLAVSLSGKAGKAPLYIVGPMPRRTCLASSDTIAMQLTSNPRSDRILSKSCAATARESVSLEGCRLSSTMSAIPDLPTAHLWKYDCVAPAAETRRATETATLERHPCPRCGGGHDGGNRYLVATSNRYTPGSPAAAEAASDSDAPAPKAPVPKAPVPKALPEAAPSVVTAAANLPEHAPSGTSDVGPPAPTLENNPKSASGAAPAIADVSPRAAVSRQSGRRRAARNNRRLPPNPFQPQPLQHRRRPSPTIWFPSARKIPKRQIGSRPIAAK